MEGILFVMLRYQNGCYTRMRANAKVSVATNAVHGPEICPNAANASEVWSAGVWDGEPDVDVTETELELDAEDVRLAEELAEDDDDDCEGSRDVG